MAKVQVMLSLEPEIAKQLRAAAMEKYGNTRSMSKYIEELATGAAQIKEPEIDACSILGQRSERSFIDEKDFNESVKEMELYINKISEIKREFEPPIKNTKISLTTPEQYFVLKEACELTLNRFADMVNACVRCNALNGPLPKFSDAGKNFALFALLDNSRR